MKRGLKNDGGRGTRTEPKTKRGDTPEKTTESVKTVRSLQVKTNRKKFSVYCKAELAYHNSTSAMLQHLSRKHPVYELSLPGGPGTR